MEPNQERLAPQINQRQSAVDGGEGGWRRRRHVNGQSILLKDDGSLVNRKHQTQDDDGLMRWRMELNQG
jgi:hypothetical protein